MASFTEAIQAQGRVVMCNLLGGPSSVPYLGGTPDDTFNEISRRINAARRYFCNESSSITPEDIEAEYGPEFTGGQCPGKPYRWKVTWQSTNPNNGCLPGSQNFCGFTTNVTCTSSGLRLWGPIGSAFIEPRPNNQEAIMLPGFSSTGVPRVLQLALGAEGQYSSLSTEIVGTCDGTPDNCGNPPAPPIPPYVPVPITINIEYQDGDNVTINEDVDFTIFAPIAIVGGNIIAPVIISGNTFQLAGEFKFSPEFKLELAPKFDISIGGNTDETLPPPGQPVPQPEPESSRRAIIGAIATVTAISGGRATQIGQAGNPDIWAPRLGNIAFLFSTSGGTAWSTDIPLKNLRQFVPCPSPLGAVAVEATPEQGYTISVVPVFERPLLPT